MTNLFTPFQGFSPAFHYLFTLHIVEKLRESNWLQKTFSLFMEKIDMDKKTVHSGKTIVIQVQAFLQHLRDLKYSQKSIESFHNGLRRFISFLTAINKERPQDVTSQDLDHYRLRLVEDNLAGATILLYLRSVKKFFAFLETKQQIFINPAARLTYPKVPRKLQPVPSVEDMKKLLNQPDLATLSGIRDRAILEIFYSSGLRLEELVGLDLGDLDSKNKTIKVLGKGSKERVLPIGKMALSWLDTYLEEARPQLVKKNRDKGAMFLGNGLGRRINPLIVERQVKDYAQAAGLSQITPHALRRACATHMLQGGAHPLEIQTLLGHSSLGTLRQYLKVTIREMKAMHEKSRLGQ